MADQQVAKQDKGQQVTVAAPRIPYDTRIEKAYGVDRGAWNVICDSVWPSAKTFEGVALALAYCKARKLDPFKRPIHVVPIWNAKLKKEVETVWPGIGELRTTANRTGDYAGNDQCDFGEDVTEVFQGETGYGEKKKTVQKSITYPEWAQFTVYKIVQGVRVAFPGPKVFWRETYATIGKTELPNSMWETRTRGQIEKCAEAAALRRAYPEVLGSQYIGEEVGRSPLQMRDITPTSMSEADLPTRKALAMQQAADAPESAVESVDVETGEIVSEEDAIGATEPPAAEEKAIAAPERIRVPHDEAGIPLWSEFVDALIAHFARIDPADRSATIQLHKSALDNMADEQPDQRRRFDEWLSAPTETRR
jgi:phage recombination protein Bet